MGFEHPTWPQYMGDLPRFPAPFLELLRCYVSWRDVQALVSVDRREAPMRSWLINTAGEFVFHNATAEPMRGILARYPRCGLRCRATYPESIDLTVADRVTNLTMRQGCNLYGMHLMTRLESLDLDQVWPDEVPATVSRVTVHRVNLGHVRLPPRTTTFRAFSCSGTFDVTRAPATLATFEYGGDEPQEVPDTVTILLLGCTAYIPVRLPSSLVELRCGSDGRTSAMSPTPSLERLTIGIVNTAVLPHHLTVLETYTAPLHLVKWPPALRRLVIGGATTRASEAFTLPESLETLHVWHGFPLALHEVALPPGLVDLGIGQLRRTVMGAVAWPPRLARLSLPTNRRTGHDYLGVSWPESLIRLYLEDSIGYATDLPRNLVRLTVAIAPGACRLKWPAGLRRLRILNYDFGSTRRMSPERVVELRCPWGLQCLVVGRSRYNPLNGRQSDLCMEPGCCYPPYERSFSSQWCSD
jgi:hypothetical protein